MPQPLGRRLLAFIREARQRKVYTAALGYLAIAMVLLQVGPPIFAALALPAGSDRVLTVLLLLGFPIVLVLAWIFDIGPGGIHRTGSSTDPDAAADLASVAYGSAARTWTAPVQEEPPVAPPDELPAAPLDPERLRRASLGFVRHELRTPINAVIGYAEMLLEDAQAEAAPGADALGRIRDGGRELLSHVESVLGAERVESETRDVASYAGQLHGVLAAPLEAVIGETAGLLAEDRAAGRSGRGADLERIVVAAQRLKELAADMERVAERGVDSLAPAASPVSTLAEGVLAKLRPISASGAEEERQGSLLVVDDSPINRDLLAKQLARRGYVVATAEDGRAALDRLAEQEFDLVLLDIIMPELDGIEVLRRIKADPRLRDIPVIMISALDEIDSVIRCLEIGAADFLSKPFHPTLLDARIGASLAARRNAARLHRGASAAAPAARRELVIGGAPPGVIARLRAGERRTMDVSARGAVLWCDVARLPGVRPDPEARAAALDALVERVRTVSGGQRCECAVAQGTGIAVLAGFAVAAADAVQRLAATALQLQHGGNGAALRLGLHVGTLCGATVGAAELSYWLWGDAIDLARGLAGEAQPGATLVSGAAHAELKDQFVSRSRGVIELPGRGQTRAWLLESAAASVAGG